MPGSIHAVWSFSKFLLVISSFGLILLRTTSFLLGSGRSSLSTQIELDPECVAGSYCIDGLRLISPCQLTFMFPKRSDSLLIRSLRSLSGRSVPLELRLCFGRLLRIFGDFSSWLEAFNCSNLARQFPSVEWTIRLHPTLPCKRLTYGRLMTPGRPKKLQSDHPFVTKDKTPLPFVQKQQLSTNRGGKAFVSKGNLQQASDVAPKEPCALLLPLVDPTDPFAKMPNLTGPFEVIVFTQH